MSQTASPPTPQPATPQSAPALPAPSVQAAPRAAGAFSKNVPRLLNRLQGLAVATCLVLGVLGVAGEEVGRPQKRRLSRDDELGETLRRRHVVASLSWRP